MRRSFVVLTIWTALASATWMGGIAEAVAAESECPSGDEWVACAANKGDPMAMYAVGRKAYEDARTSGDFTEALSWSRKLAAAKEKNGERLLKMVYLQLGWGAHRDYVQAYVWLSEAIAGGDDYLVQWRKMLVDKMTPEQVAQAKKQAGG
jgi:TPR repeat protein